ncbi:MAG: hypothetical protein KJ941_13450 [Bacteroidetes bacterium]|nr:hypothetical protein [Bacteroidota bacterium]
MNKTQLERLFEIFEEAIMDDTYTREKGPFSFRVFTSQDSTKVVIKCQHSDDTIMFYVIDYQSQEFLPDCYGTNGDDDKFSLNCEMQTYPPKIFYTLDVTLSGEFNDRYQTNN